MRGPKLALLLLFAACDQTAGLGSRYAAQQKMSAAQGGVISVPPGDAVAGASLELPPGALTADALVRIDQGSGPLLVDPPPAGPLVMFLPPELPLLLPATITLPLRLGAGQSVADVIVVAADSFGQLVKIDHAQLTLAADRVQFSTVHLGAFQPAALLRCTDLCPNGWTCLNNECHP